MRNRLRKGQLSTRYYSRGVSSPGGTELWKQDVFGVWEYTLASIVDEPHGRGHINDVTHSRLRLNNSTMSLPSALHKEGTARAEVTSVGPLSVAPQGTIKIDRTSLLQELIADANGSMPQQMALVVNAVELATLKDLIPGLLQGFTGIRKHKSVRKSLKDLAGSHLAYSFGLAPLISDFKALLGMRRAIKKRITQLEGRNCHAFRLSKRSTSLGEFSNQGYRWPASPDHKVLMKTKWAGKSTGTLSAEVTSFFVNDESSQCKMWSSALGLSSPLTNIWELVPFSFVIDWFIPIGNAFMAVEQKLGMHETVRSLDISNFCYSEKIELYGITSCTVESANYPAWDGLKFGGSDVTSSSYIRTGGIPPTDLIASPSGWTMSRTALSISLIAQKVIK